MPVFLRKPRSAGDEFDDTVRLPGYVGDMEQDAVAFDGVEFYRISVIETYS